jgi:hypothetical protein
MLKRFSNQGPFVITRLKKVGTTKSVNSRSGRHIAGTMSYTTSTRVAGSRPGEDLETSFQKTIGRAGTRGTICPSEAVALQGAIAASD